MIAILYKDSTVHLFVPDVVTVDGQDVIGQQATAKGATSDVLVIGGFTYEEDENGPLITDGSVFLRPGDTINLTDFTDIREQLPMTKEQFLQQQIDDLTLSVADIYTNGVI